MKTETGHQMMRARQCNSRWTEFTRTTVLRGSVGEICSQGVMSLELDRPNLKHVLIRTGLIQNFPMHDVVRPNNDSMNSNISQVAATQHHEIESLRLACAFLGRCVAISLRDNYGSCETNPITHEAAESITKMLSCVVSNV